MKIGFIGLGLMGEPMSINLVKKSGHGVVVFDVDLERAARVVAAGAQAAQSVGELGQACDVVFSMVPRSEHVQAVYEELLPVARPGQILADISTIDPAVSAVLAERVRATGARMLDTPVVKSRPAAIDGTLGIYVGGDAAAFEAIRPLLLCMGSNVIHLGENGRGLVMKLCHNVLVAQIQNGVNEMLTVAEAFGIGADEFATAVSFGGATNFYLDSKLATIKSGDFKAAFSLENMCKDIHCFERMVEPQGLNLPGTRVAQAVYEYAVGNALGKEDFSATIKAVRERARSA